MYIYICIHTDILKYIDQYIHILAYMPQNRTLKSPLNPICISRIRSMVRPTQHTMQLECAQDSNRVRACESESDISAQMSCSNVSRSDIAGFQLHSYRCACSSQSPTVWYVLYITYMYVCTLIYDLLHIFRMCMCQSLYACVSVSVCECVCVCDCVCLCLTRNIIETPTYSYLKYTKNQNQQNTQYSYLFQQPYL